MSGQILKFFIVFFVVVEPLSIAPAFAGLTSGASDEFRRTMAIRATVIAGLILLLFSLVGTPFLAALGISIQAFRIFGGLLLFLIALEMVFARESGTRTSSNEEAENRRRSDVSVFPLAFPLISGPGALVTILLWFGPLSITQHPLQYVAYALCVVVVLAVTLLIMLVSTPVMRIMGLTGTNVANRLFGVVLGALAVQFVIDGIRASFFAG